MITRAAWVPGALLLVALGGLAAAMTRVIVDVEMLSLRANDLLDTLDSDKQYWDAHPGPRVVLRPDGPDAGLPAGGARAGRP